MGKVLHSSILGFFLLNISDHVHKKMKDQCYYVILFRFISEIEAVCRLWLADGPKNLLVSLLGFEISFIHSVFFERIKHTKTCVHLCSLAVTNMHIC